MCVGENCAPQAVHYMNAQLTSLYENAVECIKHHNYANKPAEEYKYSHALAEYAFVDPNTKGRQTLFQANFDKPLLEFICNHDAILRLKISKGYYRLDYTRSSSMTYSEKDRMQSLSELEVSFRVPFDTRCLKGKDTKIGNGQNLIELIVLNLQKAELISANPAVIVGRDALVFYLSQYLSFLQQARYHVLFSLPDFDDDRYKLTIDYSLMGSQVLDIDEICGVSIDKINTYLSSVWLKAAMLVGAEGGAADWKDTCLAELGAPRVKAICSREAVVYFRIDEVFFYDGVNFEVAPRQQYSDWEIAVLVDVIDEFDGYVTRCKLDLSTARPYHQWCTFTGIDRNDELALNFCTRLVEFFTSSYLDVLESVDFHVIYHHDTRWVATHTHRFFEDSSESEEEVEEWTVTEDTESARIIEWKEMVTRSEMYGFDQIVAISQSSVNANFVALWDLAQITKSEEHTSALAKWSHESYFSATFRPLTLRLLSNGRAIVWIDMQEGDLKILKNWMPWKESETYHFDGWRLAFEVDLKKCTHAELDVHETWHSRFKETHVYKAHGKHTDRHLEHLYLNLRNAEFLHEFSTFEGLFHSHDHHPIDKVQAVVHYIGRYYFPYLAHGGLNILHTVPVWKHGLDIPSFALTSVSFHVYSKEVIHRHNWAQHSYVTEPIIVVLGMTKGRPLPQERLDFSTNWVVRVSKGASYGTVCLSRKAFMEERLLQLLTNVNALTTIIPVFTGVEEGVWKLDLTTWALHTYKKKQVCKWQLDSEADGYMRYIWQFRDGWKYEHEGGEVPNGTYAVSCSTRNFVELPSAARGRSMEIRIWGEVELKMSFSSGAKHGSAKSSARWDALLCMHTDVDGIKVKLAGSLKPTIESTQYEGGSASEMFTDLQTNLYANLPNVVDLKAVVDELKMFEGIWQYGYQGAQAYCLASPVFTTKGDVIFELRPHGQQVGRNSGVQGSLGRTGRPAVDRPSCEFILRPCIDPNITS
ncbi:uncharacterized protein LAESUDRAFT_274940 [Laetiporus sulphureus 93-53]|uniref:Uncharacterized protein n=1 Tax=Laetiporus sulphureus 93-53 TaxID=1314785 RepID=A0A165HBT5_9APHY|nr:uncharacterized protein LAESUDRAFT_274940 [Laetiporus sulphureus 93-53]KZT11520.1 hypothetical protein LAESUDRAFT_274940 [Laetiporus sulphureus 93-53]